MPDTILKSKVNRLFIILSGIFIANALIAEMIGGKIFSLEETLGIQPINWSIFGQSGTLQFSAGILNWPFVFIFTDIINEYYGRKGVKFLSYMTAGLIIYSFAIMYGSIHLAPAGFWLVTNVNNGVPNMQNAYSAIFGQGMWIIMGSITAFLVGQILDVSVFHSIKKVTGENKIWLRSTGSTVISQLIDTLLVGYIAFVLGPQKWSMHLFFAVSIVGYTYKVLMAIIFTPLLYFVHMAIENYLGKDLAKLLKDKAIMSN